MYYVSHSKIHVQQFYFLYLESTIIEFLAAHSVKEIPNASYYRKTYLRYFSLQFFLDTDFQEY